tara:strand:+ start:363 stop:869 length:507 start_codon:yes stop_codon:yes gene_type:complete
MSFSFNDLNLSGVEVSTSAPILEPGRYVVEVKEAGLKPTRNGGTAVELSMTDTKGKGSLRAWINVHVPSSKVATRIGREQLKALLIHGGHPNPNNPSDIGSIKGLKVGASVGKDTYKTDSGEERVGSRLKGFFDPSEIDPSIEKRANGKVDNSTTSDKSDDLEETIPF